jgi:hypothetical protein
MKIRFETTLLRQAESFTMGLNLAASFIKARRAGRFPIKLIDQARAWGVTPKAKA